MSKKTTKKPTIAAIGTRGFPGVQGGVERHCEELYTRLARRGMDLRVYARKGYVSGGPRVHDGVEVYPLFAPRKKSVEAIAHTALALLHAALGKKKFDIIHFHSIGPSLLAPVARLLGFRVVVTNHGPDYDRQKWGTLAKTFLRLGEFFGARYADEVIAVSRHIKKTLEQKYGRSVSYIPNGVRLPDQAPAGETLKRLGLTPSKYALAVGRFVPEKGFHDLLKAFKDTDTDWKLAIAGGADHEDQYSRSLLKEAGADPRVVLTGVLRGKELAEVYANAGFLVSSSFHEGLALTILEAMSFGLPILASSIPANTELVTEVQHTYRPGDVEALRKKLQEFIGGLGREASRNGRKRVETEFDWEGIADETMKVYVSAFEKRRR